MNTKLISIIIGLVLVLGTGTLVYTSKKPPYVPVPTKTDTDVTYTPPTGTTSVNKSSESEDDSDELKDITAEEDATISAPAPKPVVTTPAPKPTTPSGITMAQVAQHGTRSSCWSAINGNVYDLTSWIPNHPGGEKAILSLCGIDGSAGYNGQHGSSKKTATILGGFKLGALSK
jgi:cytochrome b involved in lipid metabolism